jgi:hypothetical protein
MIIIRDELFSVNGIFSVDDPGAIRYGHFINRRRKQMNIERQLEINEARHFRADDRYFDKMEAVEKSNLIGELIREGKTVYYVNILTKDGQFTGKTKESKSYGELSAYLIRNRYV